MNKKGFTLVELILVIVIIGIISIITIPNIMEALDESRNTSGKTVEDLLLNNLELYNIDYKEDLWCLENSNCTDEDQDGNDTDNIIVTTKTIGYDTLVSMNPDIDMGECLLYDDDSLTITKTETKQRIDEETEIFKYSYSYDVKIICSTDFENVGSEYASDADKENDNIYYKSEGIE